jgi:hypothetical protein
MTEIIRRCNMAILEGNTATMTLSNTQALRIKLSEDGETVYYQYLGSAVDDPIKEAELDYIEDTDNRTGYGDIPDEKFQPAFTTDGGAVYFIAEFLRDDYGKR